MSEVLKMEYGLLVISQIFKLRRGWRSKEEELGDNLDNH